MRVSQSRRCTPLDVMALIAATGIRLGLARTYSLAVLGNDLKPYRFLPRSSNSATVYDSANFATSAFGTGTAVTAAWLLLILNGRWRSEPAWLDGLGRGLGAYWVGIIPFSCWWDYHIPD